MRRLLRSTLWVTGSVIVVGLAVFAWLKFAPRRVPPGQPALVTIGADSLPAFKAAFNAADGEVRILAMLSPT